MKGKLPFVLSLVVFLIFLNGNVSALTEIDSCQALSGNTQYELNDTVTATTTPCFTFSGNNTIIDCAGHTINMTIVGKFFNINVNDNITIKNCNAYMLNSSTSAQTQYGSNTFAESFNGTNVNYINNTVYGIGYSFQTTNGADRRDENVTYRYNYINMTCKNSPIGTISGNNVTFKDNIININCDNITHGDWFFGSIYNSRIENSVFTAVGNFSEPITFHGIYNTVVDNITINSSLVNNSGSAMTGRFCCGENVTFENSKLYLNYPLNIYAVNRNGSNITWDNIYYGSIRELTFSIHDFDYVTIKNSEFHNTTFDVDGRDLAPSPSITNNFLFENNDFDDYVRISYFTGNGTLRNNFYDVPDEVYALNIIGSEDITLYNETILIPPSYFGLYVENSSITAYNSKFNGSGSVYDGVAIRNIGVTPPFKEKSRFYNCEFYGTRSGLTVDNNGSADVYHSSLDGAIDISLKSNGTANLYNSTIDSYNVSGSQLDVYWQLVVNNTLLASVKIYDKLDNLISEFSANKTLWLREYYVVPENNRTNSTPHNITASKVGYDTNSTLLTMDMNRLFTISLSNVSAVIYVDSCPASISNDTTYILNQSFTTNQSKCFDLSGKENIVIDGDGYFINYTRVVDESLIFADISNNITIKNLKVYGWGFDFYNTDNLIIMNNNFTGITYHYFRNVSNVWVYNNDFDGRLTVQDQILHANEYINNLTMNNNNFTGKCIYSGVFSDYSTLHNATIYNNFFNTSCSALTLGYKHDDINPYVPSSGDIEVYNNEFYMQNSSGYYAMKSQAWGDVNIYIYDNVFSSEGVYSLYVRPRNLTTAKVEIYNNEFVGDGYTFQIYAFGDIGKINNLTIRSNIFNQIGTGSWTIYIRELGNVTIRDNIVNATDSEFAYYLRDNDGFLTVINETMLKPTTAQGFYVRSSDNVNVSDSRFSGDVWSCGVSGSNVTIFENVNCEGIGIGIRVYSDTNFSVYNSTINGTLDVFTEGNVGFYNTSIDTYDTNTTGYLDVYWQLIITNPSLVTVKVYDSLNNLISEFSDSNKTLWAREYYVEPSNATTDTTPHTIESSETGYKTDTSSITMNINRLFAVPRLSLTIMSQLPSITGTLVITTGFGIIGIFVLLTLFLFIPDTTLREPMNFIRIVIAGVIVIVMLSSIWLSLVT